MLGPTGDGGIFGVTGLDGTSISGITTDILGTVRDSTSPDVGAFEFIPTSSISSIGAGKDYTTLAAFESGEQRAVPSGFEVIGEVYGTPTPGVATWSGWTFDGTSSRIVLRPATGEKHTGEFGTGAELTSIGSGSGNPIFDISAGGLNLTIQDLEIAQPNNSTNSIFWLQEFSIPSNIVIDSCLLNHQGNSGGSPRIVDITNAITGTFVHVFNSVALGDTGSSAIGAFTAPSGFPTSMVSVQPFIIWLPAECRLWQMTLRML